MGARRPPGPAQAANGTGSARAAWGAAVGLGAVVAASLALSGCGGAAARPTASAPTASTANGEGRLRALLRTQPVLGPLALRYHPASCDCPPFEVLLGGRWERAELSAADEKVAERLRLVASDAAVAAPQPIYGTGGFDAEPLRTAVGLLAVRLEVRTLVETEAPAAAEEPSAAPAGDAPSTPNP